MTIVNGVRRTPAHQSRRLQRRAQIMNEPDIQPDWCRSRQKRVIAQMEAMDLDLAIVARTPHVQWLIGPRFGGWFHPAAALFRDGHAILIAPDRSPEIAAADETHAYEAKWLSTMRSDQRHASSTAALRRSGRRHGPLRPAPSARRQ